MIEFICNENNQFLKYLDRTSRSSQRGGGHEKTAAAGDRGADEFARIGAMGESPSTPIPRTPDGKPNFRHRCRDCLRYGKPDLSRSGSAGATELFCQGISLVNRRNRFRSSLGQRRSTTSARRDCTGRSANWTRTACRRECRRSSWLQRHGGLCRHRESSSSSTKPSIFWWQVFLDGREFAPHADVSPTWHGYSTGKWDGDTLVVGNRGFNGRIWLE